MFNRIVRHPGFYTAVGTALTVALSCFVTRLTMAGAGLPLPPAALGLAFGLPGLLTPITIYPLLAMLQKQHDLRTDLERLVHTDVLTDLPNRRAFFEAAPAFFAAPASVKAPLTAMMIDIDHFKPINDSYGHDVGDMVLKRVAGVIRDEVAAAGAEQWTLARLGGEEFAVLVGGLDRGAVACLADRVCAQVHRRVGAGENLKAVTVSIGVAFCTPGMRIDGLLKAADDAVYAAKAGGRDRWAHASVNENEAPRRASRPPPEPANDRLAAG